jgi:hypothetical protein
MLDSKRREFIALLGGGGLLLAAKVKRDASGTISCRSPIRFAPSSDCM